ncbi:MAG: MFS transporter [Saprospiraceae bacterium]|nr:MFS transporter [Saprospiraceae bacterium]
MFSHLLPFLRHRAATATGWVFALQGIMFGAWAAMIPFVKHKFYLDEAELGLLLLALQGGVLVMNPFSVPVLQRWGAPAVSLFALCLTALVFALLPHMPRVALFALALFFAGSGFAVVNVAVNTCASVLESHENIRIMATCHGLWSAGAMIGSATTGVATGVGITPAVWWMIICIAIVAIVIWQSKALYYLEKYRLAPEKRSHENAVKFTWPTAGLWLLIFISLCTNVTEGTMADWSAVYMRDVVQSEAWAVGWGFAAYAFFMASGRFVGDSLLARFGSAQVLRAGGAISAAGLFCLAFWPQMPFAFVWFAMVGAGVSLGAPILYAAAARVPGLAPGAGLATLNTFAMVGFFGGPVVIGFLAKLWSLPTAFAVVGILASFWTWRSGKITE